MGARFCITERTGRFRGSDSWQTGPFLSRGSEAITCTGTAPGQRIAAERTGRIRGGDSWQTRPVLARSREVVTCPRNTTCRCALERARFVRPGHFGRAIRRLACYGTPRHRRPQSAGIAQPNSDDRRSLRSLEAPTRRRATESRQVGQYRRLGHLRRRTPQTKHPGRDPRGTGAQPRDQATIARR